MALGGIGQKPEETDCNYWVEALQEVCCKGGCNSENFNRWCCNTEFLNKLKEKKDKIKSDTQNKFAKYKLNIDKSLYPPRYGLGGVGYVSTPNQTKHPSLFSIVKDENDQPTTTTLKISEKSKKIFKDIELIKITPKKIEDKQPLDLKQIEQSGFTKEILEKNNITIKRKGVNHFEPIGQFLSKNINRAITGIDGKKQNREI